MEYDEMQDADMTADELAEMEAGFIHEEREAAEEAGIVWNAMEWDDDWG